MDKEVMTELVTIIVPVFNVEKYIGKCLASLVTQSYVNLEIIVVNDGSPDNSEEIILRFAEKDKRIKYIKCKNGGLGAARNAGLKISTGKFVCFVDSDDWVTNDYVEKLVIAANEYNSDIVICNMLYVFPDGTLKKRTPKIHENKCIESREALKQEFMGELYKFHAPNKMYKLSLFTNDEIQFPEGKLYEDIFTTYKLILKANKVAIINADLYFYLQCREGSIMNTEIKSQRFTDMYDALNKIISNREICQLNLNCEIQNMYITNVISLANYIYPLIGVKSKSSIKAYYNIIRNDKNKVLLHNYLNNRSIASVNKIRIFMINNCFFLYCRVLKILK